MSERKFKFVSPGVFLKEIDQSQTAASPEPVGPVIIGRSDRGPAMRPTEVNSYSEFVNVFGAPYSAKTTQDVWRDGNKAGTTYGAYAAKTWLKNSDKLTFIRLLGKQNADATAAGKAGWQAGPGGSDAFGLFLFASGTTAGRLTTSTGTLAAIWYSSAAATNLALSGNTFGQFGGEPKRANAVPIVPVSDGAPTSCRFKLSVYGDKPRRSDGSTTGSYIFDFNPNSKFFIRNVFNTDPSLCNSTQIDDSNVLEKFWLGESFENRLSDVDLITQGATNCFGVMMKMQASGTSNEDGSLFRQASTKAQTNWFITQDFNADTSSFDPANQQRLFKLHARDAGEWTQNNLKVSISNIRYGSLSGSYGSFDVVLRKIDDTDEVLEVVERYSNCSLDSSSPDYVARKIGDKYLFYDTINNVNRTIGQYDNKSKYMYVEVDNSVANGTQNKESIPFGVLGPIQYKSATYLSASNEYGSGTNGANVWPVAEGPFLRGGRSTNGVSGAVSSSCEIFLGDTLYTHLKVNFPGVDIRTSFTGGATINARDAYWGAYTGKSANNPLYAADNQDLTKVKPSSLGTSFTAIAGITTPSWNFSLDDISSSYTSANRIDSAYWSSTYRTAGTSVSANGGYKKVIDLNLAKFTTVFAGGSDGVDIKEKEPFRSGLADNKTDTTSYVFETYKRAIDLCAHPEDIQFNLASVPSLSTPGLTKRLMQHCENRGDALCVMDIENGFLPIADRKTNDSATSTTVTGDVNTAVGSMRDRQLNSSFGCAYYPWVQCLDDDTNKVVYLPPSVVALGVMSYTDSVKGPWFAPAGFTRGGLSTGLTGIPVLNATLRLSSKDRDNLYENRINPIATFPNEGVVVFGQKTLQVTRSALDRINVRRMLIYVKREISLIAANLLFEPNVQNTWSRFIAAATPMLIDVQQRFGIQEYKLVLDETTTTPDLIDQNIMYAKLFIKPTRAIEFIAVDFFITNTGASFED